MITYRQFIDEQLLMKKNLEKLLNEFNLDRYILTANTFWIASKYAIKIELFEGKKIFKDIFIEHLNDRYMLHIEEQNYFITKRN